MVWAKPQPRGYAASPDQDTISIVDILASRMCTYIQLHLEVGPHRTCSEPLSQYSRIIQVSTSASLRSLTTLPALVTCGGWR